MGDAAAPVRAEPPSRPRPAASANAKRAARLADHIIEDVIHLGWPVGAVLGSEADLLERYEVSRAVFREAVRLIEHREVARTRRGPGGGLVVTEPTVEAVIDAVVLYLHRADARLDEVFEARIILEEIASDLAARRLDEDDIVRLRAFLAGQPSPLGGPDARALHTFVAESSRNAALQLFVEVLHRVALMYFAGWRSFGREVAAETAHAHARIAEAVISGDAPTARRRMRLHLEAEAEYLRSRRSVRQLLPGSILVDLSGRGKLAESVARNIARHVVEEALPPGALVGTESELIEREGVSRAVLREAVRLLEYHQIARMRRGPGGGLFVVEPDTTAVTDVAAIYLARQGMELAKLSELRTALEMAIIDLAVARGGPERYANLEAALAREAASGDDEPSVVVHDLHAVLAACTGNRVLELVALVLIRLSRLQQVEKLAPPERAQVRAEILRAHTAIARAVIEGDRELARHRMQRHMDALAEVIR